MNDDYVNHLISKTITWPSINQASSGHTHTHRSSFSESHGVDLRTGISLSMIRLPTTIVIEPSRYLRLSLAGLLTICYCLGDHDKLMFDRGFKRR